MKRMFFGIFIALALLSAGPARAVTELIKIGASTPVAYLLVDSSTGQTGQTGQSPTVTVCKPGTTSFVASSGTTTELGNGDYQYAPASSETATAGLLLVHIVSSGCQTVDTSAQVVAFDPADAAALGLSNLNATVGSRSTYSGADTTGTATLLSRIPGTVQPQTGDSYARIGSPAGASVSADIATSNAAIAALNTLLTPTYPIAASLTSTGVAETLTAAQATNLQLSITSNNYTQTTTAGVTTVTYYLVGFTQISANVVMVSTVTPGTGTVRKITQPFPAGT
jgi:hypothetical protein